MAANDRSALCQPVYEFNGAVMLEAHASRERTNGGAFSIGQSLNSKQELMLLRLQAVRTSRFLTEMKEPADAIPKFS